MVSPTVQEIAQLNDRFRRFDPTVPGKRLITAGIAGLLTQLDVPMETLVQQLVQFDDFTDANDPHGERDFGVIEFHGEKLFWKIDAFNPSYSMGSDNPADLAKTHRVLTIMLASEW